MKHTQWNEELQEQALMFAAGAMDESERQEYIRHLELDNCALCRSEVAEFSMAAQSLALGLPEQRPSENVKARLMAQAELQAGRQPAVTRPRGWQFWTGWLAAAAALLALAVTLSTMSELRDQVQSLAAQSARLEEEVTQTRSVVDFLTQPQVRVVNLGGQGAAPGARARIFWDETRGLWRFYADSLPQAAANRSYQLWFVPKSGNPVSAAVFDAGPDGSVDIEISLPPDAQDLMAAAVTDEPAGGVPQPTGPFVLFGSGD